ncbi:protein of unknown function DUF45 [Thermaerobacter marianensis DSM 12885]|uniref:YgjP-like metallopeptidase domain-containing protein n=1 Tax=Thermaerobacter marianensis (strain ATCC 700841 / DSM 12885 / JCM 10246 / 7p75a) TaxID=644966 RepID=E6SLV1_THEM7|nr:SprT family zinc-dependent metalloprotease [Thermaerobacter marianensis]ADU51400.1 protein of unknown function DUF45 [Thermaerobacter marianensis DSM 12885]
MAPSHAGRRGRTGPGGRAPRDRGRAARDTAGAGPAGGAAGEPLPRYTVRVSARARRVRLVMSPAEGLVVVVPRGYALRRVPQLVAQHAEWIRRARRRLEQQDRVAGGRADDPAVPPAWLLLRALGEAWQVVPQDGPTGYGTSGRAGGPPSPAAGFPPPGDPPGGPLPPGLALAGRVVVPPAVQTRGPEGWAPVLRRWLAARARESLVPWLERLARERGFPLAGASVGCPKTRWGSCSAAGRVRLSLKLLFLPRDLVEHVLIHELCHTVHLHHGPAFWALVHRHDPDAAAHRRQLRAAWSYVPAWLRPARSIGPSPADRTVPPALSNPGEDPPLGD